jgi:serine protease Do
VTPERAKALNLKEERGAEVTRVTDGSPAAKAGIKLYDVVLEYNGQAVQGTAQFVRLVQETPPDRQVKIAVWRNGKAETLTATVGTNPGMSVFSGNGSFTMPEIHINPPLIDIPSFQMNWQNPRLGIVGEALGQEAQLADFFGVKEGVLVKSVVKDSAAEKAGIKAGDVIVKVDDSKVTTTDEIGKALRNLNKTAVPVVVVRNRKETSLTVTIESRVGTTRPAIARVARV